ncbi:hypothetical protein Leryth_006491 [Lithospermum erythrorhizon]|nr:hypothetical protein Leryth_006491 [Lithospermum erythrorhizon]
MALGRYSRIDGKKSSSGYCSSATIVGFVALCLVGVWMMTSSSVVPVQNSDVSSGENQNDVKSRTQISDSNENTGSTNDNSEASVNNDKGISSDDTQQEQNSSNVRNENQQTGNAENKETEEKTGDGESKSEFKGEDKKENVESKSDSEAGETKEGDTGRDSRPVEGSKESKSDADSTEKKPEVKTQYDDKPDDQTEEKVDKGSEEKTQNNDKGYDQTDEKVNKGSEEKVDKGSEETTQNNDKGYDQTKEKKNDISNQGSVENKENGKAGDQSSNVVYPSVSQSELLNETTIQNGSFSTQAAESKTEKEAQRSPGQETKSPGQETMSPAQETTTAYKWKLCNTTAGPDYIPCLDNVAAIKHLKTTKHYEHRERHCPDNPPTCLVPLPQGYQRSILWPTSREKIWYHNVPHTKLAAIKGHQNWVKVTGEFLTFPGGGTQFKHGALHYIDFIQETVRDIGWGKRSRVVLDVGCGVASFGGFQFDRNVLTMSLAPKDEHEAQVQFALERGIPAISAVMGTKRLPYPGRVFDVVHCARCRVPWHIEGGKLLLELNRMLRPGGFFVWSATPVYQKKNQEDTEIWQAMQKLTKSMCWEVVSITKDKVNKVGIAIFRKPSTNKCYEQRKQNVPPLCSDTDDPNAAWNVSLQACMHKIPVGSSERGSQWPEMWPARVEKPPYWLLSSQTGVYGKPAPEDFTTDYKHWKRVVETSYLKGMAIDWSTVRNAMDMRAVYGGFAAALKDLNVWVMNIVTVDSPDTLPIIYERGLFGIYHDWCESFSTYPRSYDLLHADHLFSKIKKKCNFTASIVEVDRILRPEGKIIIRDDKEIVTELESMFKSMNWEIRMAFNKKEESLLCAQKSKWRPNDSENLAYAIGNIS